MRPILQQNVPLEKRNAARYASQLHFATINAPRLYGNDIEIGYKVIVFYPSNSVISPSLYY